MQTVGEQATASVGPVQDRAGEIGIKFDCESIFVDVSFWDPVAADMFSCRKNVLAFFSAAFWFGYTKRSTPTYGTCKKKVR